MKERFIIKENLEKTAGKKVDENDTFQQLWLNL